MSRDKLDQQLDQLLKQSEPELIDDGFSDAVMRSLPRKKFYQVNSRRLTLAIAAATGSVLTMLLAPPLELVLESYNIVLSDDVSSLIVPAFLGALFILPLVWLLRSE